MVQTRGYLLRLIGLLLLLCTSALAGVNLPSSQGMISDFANKLTPPKKRSIEQRLRAFRDRSGIDLAVVIIPSSWLNRYSIEHYALEAGRQWKVGRGSQKLGLLLLIAIKPPDNKGIYQGQTRLEVSRHLEGDIPDGLAGEVIRGMRIDLKAGRFDQAVTVGVDTIIYELTQRRGIPAQSSAPRSLPPLQVGRVVENSRSNFPFGEIFIFLLVITGILWLATQGTRRRRGFSWYPDATRRDPGRDYDEGSNIMGNNWFDTTEESKQSSSSLNDSFGIFGGSSHDNSTSSGSSDPGWSSTGGSDYSSSNDSGGGSFGGGGDFGGGGASDSW